MEPTIRDTLRGLILRYGRSLCEDATRCQGMLNDLLRGQHEREVVVPVSALRAGIAADLLDSGGLPAPPLVGQLRQRLENDLGMTGEAAHWAAQWEVETWAIALGVVDTPVPVQPAPPTSARLPFEPAMVAIPAGRFLMGSPPDEPERLDREGPQHWVQVSAFVLGKYAVTFDEWDVYVAASGYPYRLIDKALLRGRFGRGRRPVISVSWHDAQRSCRWLSDATGKTYRLPSEAEWEYACGAGTTTPFNTGRCINTDQANYNGTKDYADCGAATGVYLKRTQAVGSYPPNPWGLHEMHGNVFEWVEDCWNNCYEGSAGLFDRLCGPVKEIKAPMDGSTWLTGNYQKGVLRGGSWRNNPSGVRSATRGTIDTRERDDYVGFRVASDA